MHDQPVVCGNGKPEIITFYNSTKGGVDTFNQWSMAYCFIRLSQEAEALHEAIALSEPTTSEH